MTMLLVLLLLPVLLQVDDTVACITNTRLSDVL